MSSFGKIGDNIEYINNLEIKGIDIINEKFKIFEKKKISSDIKIIIIDNIDNMAKKCQILINWFINSHKNLYFIFICNNIQNIIESIQNKTTLLCFNNFDYNKYCTVLQQFCKEQNIITSNEVISFLIMSFNYDIRIIVNNLEIIKYNNSIITIDNIKNFIFLYYPKELFKIIYFCINGNIISCINNFNIVVNDGYNCNDILLMLIEILKLFENNLAINNNVYDIEIKIEKDMIYYMIKKLYKWYNNLNTYINDNIELYYCFAWICKKKYKNIN